jgi:hypothetical protein
MTLDEEWEKKEEKTGEMRTNFFLSKTVFRQGHSRNGK